MLYTKRWMKVTKLHTFCHFAQMPCLPKYIKHNADRRAKAKTKFEKFFPKLLINDFYGKLIENIQKRIHLDLIDETDTQKNLLYSQRRKSVLKLKNMGNLIHIQLTKEIIFSPSLYT